MYLGGQTHEGSMPGRVISNNRHSERHRLHSAYTMTCVTKHTILNDALHVIHKQTLQ